MAVISKVSVDLKKKNHLRVQPSANLKEGRDEYVTKRGRKERKKENEFDL